MLVMLTNSLTGAILYSDLLSSLALRRNKLRELKVCLVLRNIFLLRSAPDALPLMFMRRTSAAVTDRCVVSADGRSRYAECHAVCGWMARQRDDHRV